MSRYIQFAAADGGAVVVEIDKQPDAATSGFVRGGPGEKAQEAVIQVQTSFEDAIDVVRRNADTIIQKLHTLDDPPTAVEVSFGLKAAGELGNFAIARAGMEANYSVKLMWRREKKEDKEPEDKGHADE
jgi:hypothetical protein